MISLVTELFAFFFKQTPAVIWRRIRGQDMPWIVQLAVYGFCGVVATVVAMGQAAALSATIIPAYENMIVDGLPIADGLRAKNFLINQTISFVTTNVLVYFMNVLLVFKRGRHGKYIEFAIFTLINCMVFLLSQFAGSWLILKFGIATNLAFFTNAVFAALINFVARKFFVFKS